MTLQNYHYESEILEARLAIGVMLAMGMDDRPMRRGILYGKVAKTPSTTVDRVEDLIAAKLIEQTEAREDNANVKIISLTPKGRRVAEHLLAIEEILTEKG